MNHPHTLKHRQPGRITGPRHKVPRYCDDLVLELRDTARHGVSHSISFQKIEGAGRLGMSFRPRLQKALWKDTSDGPSIKEVVRSLCVAQSGLCINYVALHCDWHYEVDENEQQTFGAICRIMTKA